MAKITFQDKVSLNPQPSIAEVNKCTDANINEIKTCINDNCTYSTSEICIGEWIDGKDLYRRVFTGTTPNSASGSVNFNVSVDTIVHEDMFVLSDSNYFVRMGYYESGSVILSYTINKSLSIYFSNVGTTMRNKSFTLIVEYTK